MKDNVKINGKDCVKRLQVLIFNDKLIIIIWEEE